MVSYHPTLPNIVGILHRLHPVLQSSRRCSEFVPGVPTSLKDTLVHLELKTPRLIKDCVRCGDGRCRICKFLVEAEYFLKVALRAEAM